MNRIFKFRGASNLDLEAFHDDCLWFSSFPELNDPFEGGFKYDSSGVDVNLRIKFLSRLYKESNPQNYNDIVTDVFASLGENEFSNFVDERTIDACRSFGEEYQKNNFIHSFSIAASDDEFPQPLTSMLLWSHYANGFKGFCVEFDFDKLKESLSLLNDTNIGSTAVHYPDNCEFPTVSLKTCMLDMLSDGGRNASIEMLQAFGTKHPAWNYECEGRFISQKRGKHQYMPNAIRSVYISDRAPNWIRQFIINNMRMKNKNTNIYNVKTHNSKYELGFSKIE